VTPATVRVLDVETAPVSIEAPVTFRVEARVTALSTWSVLRRRATPVTSMRLEA
jgi:hypothetical protein